MLRKVLVGLGVLLLAALLLVWFLPARVAMLWIAPPHGLRLQRVSGLLWDGSAGQVMAADGRVLGQLHWQLSREALLGKVQLQWTFSGPQLEVSGSMQKLSADQVEWRDVQARADLAVLDPYAKLPIGQPRGELRISVPHALLQAGWPLQLQANAEWSNAALHARDGDIALGVLQLQAQSQNGVISAQLHDEGHGPLQADGQLQLSPLGWRLDALLRPRHTDAALHQLLAQLGRSDASGNVTIQRSGGMAMGLPPTSSDRKIH
jgi:general secretion pathway protein N